MLHKLTIAVVVLASSFHSADANCQLQKIYGTTVVPLTGTPLTMGAYNVLSDSGGICTAACSACGQSAGISDSLLGDAIFPAAIVEGIGAGICPTITFTDTVALTVPADNCPGLGIGPVATAVSGIRFNAGSTGGLISQGLSGDNAVVVCNSAATVANIAKFCNCVTTNVNTCSFCGCADLGIPTSAPTGIPTTAPTAATSSPTSGGNSITGGNSDDSLSGGAIAGIVIGSIVGAALVIGAGVMIGSK
jgi:hypothetical protein